ncbi:hypothetical protein ANCDUO_16618 [Ancylostoma duodenale]|uniref:Uncharacterized protein n=1 Tax=Ancylostoma duodenale TaxID=51022 RepID=A0A0C2G2X9_9BILA|nr:hypothetical protein ANCDUO_16618 [Ancylostoma duodenale]
MLSVSLDGQNPLDNSGSRDGQMEGLLAPARYIRRSTGVKVIKYFAIKGPHLTGPAACDLSLFC